MHFVLIIPTTPGWCLRIDSLACNVCKYFFGIALQDYELVHYTGNFLSAVAMHFALAIASTTYEIEK